LLAALKAKNAEFPLGVDAMLVSADECVICLPRTTRVAWETL
jgi:alpha-D-ribose 1-methylphosphonate 5-triphosphate synthase subunit PhnH